MPPLATDMEATHTATGLLRELMATAVLAIMASAPQTLSPDTAMDMEVMEDTVLVAMEDTVVTVTAMASKMFPSFCDHLPLNNLAFVHSCILTNK